MRYFELAVRYLGALFFLAVAGLLGYLGIYALVKSWNGEGGSLLGALFAAVMLLIAGFVLYLAYRTIAVTDSDKDDPEGEGERGNRRLAPSWFLKLCVIILAVKLPIAIALKGHYLLAAIAPPFSFIVARSTFNYINASYKKKSELKVSGTFIGLASGDQGGLPIPLAIGSQDKVFSRPRTFPALRVLSGNVVCCGVCCESRLWRVSPEWNRETAPVLRHSALAHFGDSCVFGPWPFP